MIPILPGFKDYAGDGRHNMATRTILSIFIMALACACRSAPSIGITPRATTPSAASPATGDNSGLTGTYDTNNPFARIILDELPASKVYEDEHVLAFMPLRMISRGHVIVISKTSRARNNLDIEPEEPA